MMELVTSVFISGEGRDYKIWEPGSHGQFSVKSFSSHFLRSGECPRFSPIIWKSCAPLKVKIFGWSTGLDKILTFGQEEW